MNENEFRNVALEIFNNLSDNEKSEFEYPDKPVVGYGDIPCDLLVVGRDLGKDEVKEGIPLIGRAGAIFRLTMETINRECYTTNIVPFKPVDNKAFSKDIAIKFIPLLKDIIHKVKPRAIISLGNESTRILTSTTDGILSLSENMSALFLRETFNWRAVVFPVVHPSYLLRQGMTSFISLKNDIQLEEQYKKYFFTNIYLAHKFLLGEYKQEVLKECGRKTR